MVLDTHAPAAVLINQKGECLYSLGQIERYLRVASGFPTQDLLAMATPALRAKLRSAIRQVGPSKPRRVIAKNRIGAMNFSMDVQRATLEGEELLLVCFNDEPAAVRSSTARGPPPAGAEVDTLRAEFEEARAELEIAHRSIDESAEEHKAINEEALSVNEEFQAANEELLTSKEELQSLNEELTALNSQLQETIERERTTADDLQNVLYSTGIATLFLDPDLKIRFFTPATLSLFNVISGDVGRPLTDLRSLAPDGNLIADAGSVLADHRPMQREIKTPEGKWFVRRILPYRVAGKSVQGVVITFTDITERKQFSKTLEAAKRSAEGANLAKSRFLAAASHDLRQPLQSLTLVHALLTQTVEGEKPMELVVRMGQTLAAVTGMLNALLDINQIEAGVVEAQPSTFPIDDVLGRLHDEFVYEAEAKRLDLRAVASSLTVYSDPRLLEQMIRNLLANALKYTKQGKILLGCRRQAGTVHVEIWDTGVGIDANELQAIFEEFHQLDNLARERHLGLGLGLSIVKRLGELLGHAIEVRSVPGKGSVFSIVIARGAAEPAITIKGRHEVPEAADRQVRRRGEILIVEDDFEVRELLELLLTSQGYSIRTVPDAAAALELVTASAYRPEMILTDYNLPGDMNGVTLLARLRYWLHYPVPGIILSGAISTSVLAEIAQADCRQLSKPVNADDLVRTIEQLLVAPTATAAATTAIEDSNRTERAPTIFVVDDDADIRASLRDVLEQDGQNVSDFADAEAFLTDYHRGGEACLLVDAYLPGMNGIGLLEQLRSAHDPLPTIVFTGSSDVAIAVKAMRAGASDFIEKPVTGEALLTSIHRALAQSHEIELVHEQHEAAAQHLAGLTVRQRQVLDLVLAGHPSKNIAEDLGISQRTVENHRASIMHKTGAKSLPELARLAVAAEPIGKFIAAAE
jgi:two-component system CheB/CheR fusion protein